MKVLIVSDTHRHEENLIKAIEQNKPFDYLIHLGDVEGSEDYIRRMVTCPVCMVCGNNDFFSDLPKEIETTIGPFKVLLTHGNYYYVSLGTEEIRRQAVSRGVDIVMFGHTHKPYLEVEEHVTVLNPGSLSYPRQDGRQPSYILMEIDEEGTAHYEIKFLEKKA